MLGISRHGRTLRETIGWSYDLLEPAERTLFSRLSVFVGGWALEAATAVANPGEKLGDTLEFLGLLVDRSLVRTEGGERFGMLETIREFGMDALESSGEAEEIRRRHALYYADMAEAAAPELTLRDRMWLGRLEREHDKIRAALRWSIDSGEAETGLRIAGSMWRFWWLRGHFAEGRRWTGELLALPAGARTPARAKALSAAGSLAYYMLDIDAMRGAYEESLAIAREVDDRRCEAEGLYNLAFSRFLAGDLHDARELLQSSAQMYHEMNDPLPFAHARTALGMVAFEEGDLETTRALIEEARGTFVRMGDLWGETLTLGQLAALAMREGNLEESLEYCLQSLEVNQELGHVLGTGVGLQGVAVLAARMGRPDVAVRLGGAVHRLREMAGGQAPPSIVGLEDPREVAEGVLTGEQIATLWEEGRAMTLDEAVSLAHRLGKQTR